MKRYILCVVIGFQFSTALAQTTIPPAQSSLKIFVARPQIRLMAELKAAEAAAAPAFLAFSKSPTPDERRTIVRQYSRELQHLGNIRTFTGDDQGAIAAFDARYPSGRIEISPANKEIIAAASVEDAISAIVKMATNRQVVILNEAHHVPMHRAFALKLAKELKKIGFTYLAVEALTPQVGLDPLAKGYVDLISGYYVREPVFAQFLRETKASGWTLVPYEPEPPEGNLSRTEQILSREIGQAKNIVDSIFSKQPDAKVFIYVGYGHAAKVPLLWPGEGPLEMMAAQLKKLTKIDPLTIDQSVMFERNVPLPGNAVFQEAVSKFAPSGPVVIRKKDGSPVLDYSTGGYDLQVLHPPSKRVGERAGWLGTLANRTPVDIPVSLLSDKSRRLIYAFYEADGPTAAPADVVLVTPGTPVPKFMLPPGKFRYEYEE